MCIDRSNQHVSADIRTSGFKWPENFSLHFHAPSFNPRQHLPCRKHWELEISCGLSCFNSSHTRVILTCHPHIGDKNYKKIPTEFGILTCKAPNKSLTSSRADLTHCPGISRAMRCWHTQSALQSRTALELSSASTASAKKPGHHGRKPDDETWTNYLASIYMWWWLNM